MLSEFVAWLLSGWFEYVGDIQTDRAAYDAAFADVMTWLSVLLPVCCIIAFLWMIKGVFGGRK